MSRAVSYNVHPERPQRHKVAKIARALAEGAVMLYPTDTVYALGCDPHHKEAVERLLLIKDAPSRHPLTLLCPTLSEIATYAHVDDEAFKLMKTLTPGPYTFILKATKEVPRLVLNPKRTKVGLRIPASPICQSLLGELQGPLISTSAHTAAAAQPESLEELVHSFAKQVDIMILDGRRPELSPSTVLDLSQPEFEIIREGQGFPALQPFLR